MIRKIGITVVALLLFGATVFVLSYTRFRSEQLDALVSASLVADTAAGQIEYQLTGDSDSVLLFLHGTPGGYDQAPSMPGFRVLAPSRPGYLRTPLNVGITPEDQARAYVALLDTLDIDKVVVMGASGGGPSSIFFAAAYPERTQGLIAMEAVSQKIELLANPIFMKTDFLLWTTLTLLDTVMGAEGVVGLLVPDPAIQQLILEDPEKTESMTGLLWSLWPISQRNLGQQNDVIQFARLNLPSQTITVPTLILHGTDDINVPYRQSQQLVAQIPGAILHTIEGGDHMMPFSHSEEVERVVEQFVIGLGIDRGE